MPGKDECARIERWRLMTTRMLLTRILALFHTPGEPRVQGLETFQGI